MIAGAHRRFVDNEARGDVGNMFKWLHTVGLKSVAGIDNINNLVSKIHNRRKFHCPIKPDDIGLDATR